jgi:hypothetical protein
MEKNPIGFIHDVPVYGRLPQRFQNNLIRIESITTAADWKGIKFICSSDKELELSPNNPNINGGNYLYNDEPFGWPVTYEDGTEEIFIGPGERVPIIFLNSGLFKSEYWHVFTLLHELGHHNDPSKPTISSKIVEKFAHHFALDRVNKGNFTFINEQPPMFYDEAKREWKASN